MHAVYMPIKYRCCTVLYSKSNVQINHTTLICLTVFNPFRMYQQRLLLHVITVKADVDGVGNHLLFNIKFDTVNRRGGGAD